MRFFVVGHANAGRVARRQTSQRSKRFLRFGNDFVVRPKRRTEISAEVLFRHADALLEAIAAGTVTLQSSTDVNVTVAELHELRSKYSTAAALVAQEGTSGEVPEMPVEPAGDSETAEVEETVAEEPQEPSEPSEASQEAPAEEPPAEEAPEEPAPPEEEILEAPGVVETPVTRSGKKGRR